MLTLGLNPKRARLNITIGMVVEPGRRMADLSVAGLRTAEIAWTSTVRFYAKACGATVSRTSLVMTASLGTSVDAS